MGAPQAEDKPLPKTPAPVLDFPISPIPKNPLGEGQYIKTAAALIIGYVSFSVEWYTTNMIMASL